MTDKPTIQDLAVRLAKKHAAQSIADYKVTEPFLTGCALDRYSGKFEKDQQNDAE